MRVFLWKFHMYLEEINFQYRYWLEQIPENLSLDHSPLFSSFHLFSMSNSVNTFVNKFAQVAPQEFPLFSWWCIFLECFCNIGWCLLCGWCVCPSKESWTQIRFGSRKHHSSWHLKGHLQVWSSVANDTVYQLFDWPHAGVGLYSSSHTNYIQAWKRKIDSAYAWYSTKQGGWVVRALKSWNPEVAGSSPLWPLSWSCFSVYW